MVAVSRRIESIDVMRVLAMAAVIALHTATYSGPHAMGQQLDGANFLNQAERFAVPFFFVISGYLWADRCGTPEEYWARSVMICRRAILIFLVWSVVYLIFPAITAMREYGIAGPVKVLVWEIRRLDVLGFLNIMFEGTKVHLWFLPALALAALISGALLSRGREIFLIFLAVLLFVLGLAGSAYGDSPFGFKSHFNFRNGPFFSLLTFVTGYAVQRYGDFFRSFWTGAVTVMTGLLLQLFEVSWIQKQWGTALSHDYVIGTYFMGVGMALVALSNVRLLRASNLASIGPLILGVYACHFLFVDLLRPADDVWHGYLFWDIGYVVLVFALSLSTTFSIARVPAMRRFVM